jgi:hypothetical protein
LIKTKFYTGNDTVERSYSLGYEGQILVLPVSSFSKQYQEPQFQLFRANGGFGCSPETMGTAVFGHFIYDGEECRYSRNDFIGVLKPELVAELNEEDFPFLNKK